MRHPAALFLCLAAMAAPLVAAAASPPREVNIAKDSAPGWRPTPELETEARRTVLAYLAALDGGRFAQAYAALVEANRRADTLAAFTQRQTAANAHAGPVLERRITKVTWTKDPAQAPAPGVYAAIDLVSRFAQIDRDCSYIVLFQPSAGGPFQVARIEESYLDNASAEAIASAQSDDAVEDEWAQLSAHCPNYAAGPRRRRGSAIGYTSPAAAYDDLKLRSGVTISVDAGWTLAQDPAAKTIWAWPPTDDPAYPAVVRQQLVKRGGLVTMKTDVLCQATRAACDDLVQAFEDRAKALQKRPGKR